MLLIMNAMLLVEDTPHSDHSIPEEEFSHRGIVWELPHEKDTFKDQLGSDVQDTTGENYHAGTIFKSDDCKILCIRYFIAYQTAKTHVVIMNCSFYVSKYLYWYVHYGTFDTCVVSRARPATQ